MEGDWRLWGSILDGQHWVIGTGEDCLFWLEDWRSGGSILLDSHNLFLPILAMNSKVVYMVGQDENWDIEGVRELIESSNFFYIISEVSPRDSRGVDQVVWKHESNGKFSVKRAYFNKVQRYPKNPMFATIWKLKCLRECVFLFGRLLKIDCLPGVEAADGGMVLKSVQIVLLFLKLLFMPCVIVLLP